MAQPKISVVWNGVDPEKDNPANCKAEDIERLRESYEITSDEKMIFFLGRLTWIKGVRNLVQAMPLVLEEFQKVELVILGKGEQQSDIQEAVYGLGIKDKVI